jgi:uncharacterized repeat protein (TIGR02543 family)
MKKSFKIFISTILVLVLMMTVAFAVPGINTAPGQVKKQNTEAQALKFEFNDMTGYEWAMKSVQSMAAMGKIKGIGNGKFAPASATKQIEVLIMALRYLGLENELDSDALLPPAYKGMKPQDWMIPYLELAIKNYILTESEASNFNPNAPATRSWTAVIIVRALGEVADALKLQDTPLPYKDAAAVPVDRIGYVNYVTQEELMIGYDNTFQPNKPLSRAEMAVLFGRLYGTDNNDELHKITFDENGGSLVADRIVYHNTRIGALPEISRTGYTFAGWYTDANPAIKVNSRYIVTDDVTLKAEWIINKYTITFDTNGAKTPTPTAITLEYGKDVDAPDEPKKDDKQFLGWYPELPKTMPAMNMMLVAQWELEPYTISFDENGGSAVANVTQDYGTKINTAPVSTKTGYTLEGWYADSGLTLKIVFPYTITADATLYAKWTINEYTVSFNENGGSSVSNITEDFNTIIAAAPVSTKTGYTLQGWYTEETLTNKLIFPYTIQSNVTLHAKWTINEYTLTFNSNGGSAVAPITEDYNTVIAIAPVTEKDDFDFDGWFSDEELTEEVEFPYTITENITLYAKWIVATED